MERVPLCLWWLRCCLAVTVARICFECQLSDVAMLFVVFCSREVVGMVVHLSGCWVPMAPGGSCPHPLPWRRVLDGRASVRWAFPFDRPPATESKHRQAKDCQMSLERKGSTSSLDMMAGLTHVCPGGVSRYRHSRVTRHGVIDSYKHVHFHTM